MSKPVCAILGVGPGNGMACARRFAAAGYALALCSRRGPTDAMIAELGAARGYRCDATHMPSLDEAFRAIENDLGPVEILIFNAGSAHWGSLNSLDDGAMTADFDVNAAGLFRAARCAVAQMRKIGRGAIIVIGAGAALRGRPSTIAFAAGKAAQRSVAQSLARQLGPENIHVGYLVLDGIVDLDTRRAAMPDKDETFFLSAAGVAEAAYALVTQNRQAWTFEMDLRPFKEAW